MRIELKKVLFPQPKSKIKAGDGKANGKYKFFTSSPMQSKFVDEANYDKPALIFGTGGNASVHFCNEPFSTSTDCLVMYGRSKTELETIYNYLKSNIGMLENGFKGAGLKHISKDYILAIEIDLPSEEIQLDFLQKNRIIDGLIEAKQAQLHLSEELVKSRFIEMFGDISQADKNSFVSMDSFCTISSSKRVHVADYVNSGIPFYRSKEIIELGENKNPSVELFISREHYEAIKQKNYIPQKNDILMSAVGTIGKMWIVDGIREFYYKDGNIMCIHSDSTNAIYLKFALSMLIDDFKDGNVGGSAYSALTIVKLNKMLVPLPPISLQNSFAEFVKQIEKSKLEIQQSIYKLETLKKSLMQQYFG